MACCFSCRKSIPGYCVAHGKKCTDASKEHLCIWCDCEGHPDDHFIALDVEARSQSNQAVYYPPAYGSSYRVPANSFASYSSNYIPTAHVQVSRYLSTHVYSNIRTISIPRSSVKHSGAYIIRKNTSTGFDEILLQARAEHLGGVLCGPGGQINNDENDVVTPASREAWEEAGIDLSDIVGVPFLKKGSVACVAFVVPSNIQVRGPRSSFSNEVNLRYNFSQIPGATLIPGTGHAWVKISTLITWLRNQPRRHELFVQALEHLEH